jgi:catechol 2,3-dioxygenase-like lactoylglutathione lyase family enzyme
VQLLDHLSITVRDLAGALPFYDAIMGALGVHRVHRRGDAVGYGERNRRGHDGHTYLSVLASASAAPDPRRHWCLRASSEAMVRAFHAAGLAAGGRDGGAPGRRPHYHDHYYAAFVEDPEGNRIEAVFHG